MKRLIAIALLLAGCGTTGSDVVAPSATPAPVATPSPSPAVVLAPTPDGPTEEATVTRVIDGDTIEVALDGALFTVRYIGIDTPETKAPNTAVEFMGPQAAAANAGLVEGKTVYLERDVSETDSFGRLLRHSGSIAARRAGCSSISGSSSAASPRLRRSRRT